jgi:hydrogenase maturation protease
MSDIKKPFFPFYPCHPRLLTARCLNDMISVIGIGQSLRGDDEAGLAAVRLWDETYRGWESSINLHVELAESPGVSLLSIIENSKAAVLVDAVQSGANPGAVHKLHESDLASFLDGADNAHGWGVAETLALGRQLGLGTLPPKIVIIGIEAGQVAVGEGLSPEVHAALPLVAGMISETIKYFSASRWD